MDDTHFLYFAYGSNLLTRRLRERTPSAEPLGWGTVPGLALRWHMASRDGSAKCDIVEDVATHLPVHGVVYRIAREDKPALDRAESLGVGYHEAQVTVRVGSRRVPAGVYRALRTDAALRPYDWYHALVLAGAREHGLPPDYVRQLASVPTRVDSDGERARRHFALVRMPA